MMAEYIAASDRFFEELIDSNCHKSFLEVMRIRADKVAREICLATEVSVTDILKGQLSICYELADGVVQALKAREEKANSDREGGSPDVSAESEF